MEFKKNAIGYRVIEEAGYITFLEYHLIEESETKGWATGYYVGEADKDYFLVDLKRLGNSKREAIMLYMQQKIEEKERATEFISLARKKLFEEIL